MLERPPMSAVARRRGGSAVVVRMRWALLLATVATVWLLSFFAVWRSTEVPARPCNDTVDSSAACTMPQPSLLPAVPVATASAFALGGGLALARRRP